MDHFFHKKLREISITIKLEEGSGRLASQDLNLRDVLALYVLTHSRMLIGNFEAHFLFEQKEVGLPLFPLSFWKDSLKLLSVLLISKVVLTPTSFSPNSGDAVSVKTLNLVC